METHVVPSLNTTRIGNAPPVLTSLRTPQTPVSRNLQHAGNSSGSMRPPNAGPTAVATGSDETIAPPVLSRRTGSANDFIDQKDLDRQWCTLQKALKVATLSEQGAVAILSSGILQTDTGRALAGLVEDAMLRSMRPSASMNESGLQYVVDVLCHRPPDEWQNALGENVRFPSAQKNPQGVAGFIQSQLDRSSELRDGRIANDELLKDVHWQTLKHLTEQGRQYIGVTDDKLDRALMMLEDSRDVRPSPKEAHAQLETFVRHLAEPCLKQTPWTERYVAEVKALRDQINPDDGIESSWLDWLDGPSWVEGLFGRADSTSSSKNAAPSAPSPLRSNDTSPWPLSAFIKFERSADFRLDVTNSGPRIPESMPARLLYACNVLHTFNALSLDRSHITGRPGVPPNGTAWKNGAADFIKSPLDPGSEATQTGILSDPLATLGRFAADADEILNQIARSIVPWDSANAVQEEIHELEALVGRVYRSTTVELESVSPDELSKMKVELGGWLARMSGYLLGTGAAVFSRTGELIEQNPLKTLGLFAIYVATSNFYANWFLPEAEEAVDPLQGIELAPGAAPNETSLAFEYAVESVVELFEESPVFAAEVKELILQSKYSDPADDPALIDKLAAFMQQSVPGDPSATYQDYVNEIAELAELDAHDEFVADPVSESSNAPAATANAQPLNANVATNVRSKRSVNDGVISSHIPTSVSGSSAHTPVNLLIRAGQRSLDAENGIGPGEEIVPGVTITQAADLFIKDFVELQTVLDPSLFILSSIEHFIADSDLSEPFKSSVTYRTLFKVDYDTPPPNGKHGGYYHATTRHKMFSLAELLMGRHEKEAKSRERVKIAWSPGYTTGFRNAVTNTNLWQEYKVRAGKCLSQPQTYEMWKDSFKFKLRQLVGDYRNGTTISEQGKKVADQFLNGEIRVRPVGIKQGKYGDKLHASNVVFLSKGSGPEGLFVFQGGNETVIESPVELFKEGGKSIEEFPQLRNALSNRIPLFDMLSRDDDDFKYSQGRFIWDWNPVHMFENYKWPYQPIIFGRKDGPTYHGEYHDAFKDLFEDIVSKAKSDMDTMISTAGERSVDKFLEILTEMLALYAMILALPGVPTVGVAFMMGASASSAQYLRGAVNDDPLEASRHKGNAIKGMISQIAAPHIGKVLGTVISKAVDSRIAEKIFERLRYSGFFPKEIARHFPKSGHTSSPLSASANKIDKWIAPRVRNPWIIQNKVDRRLTNNMVVSRLNSLDKGPKVAEKLMERSRITYFGGPQEGYVYQGFAMRGDGRMPQDVFKNGFKSNGPANPISPDRSINPGVELSGYYNSNGMGAFHQGGKINGYTYLVDVRKAGALDVRRTEQWLAGSGSRVGSNPYQLRSPDIPGSSVLGAYDSTGKFFPNPNALKRAIEKSVPHPFTEKVPFPIKGFVQNRNATQTPIKFPH